MKVFTKGWRFVEAGKFAVMAVCFSASLVATVQAQDKGATCWKPTYGRGAGNVPGECGPGESKEAGLCYTACPTGFLGVALQCHQICPQGFGSVTAIDATCSKPAKIPRGAYPVASAAQCNAESSGRGCEQIGTALYVRPPQGYVCEGPICQASCPVGMADNGIGGCRKLPPRMRNAGVVPQCGGGGEYQLGLCYKTCTAGFGGAGPVCWGQCPSSHPTDCGAMCGTNTSQCAANIANQAISVLDFAVTVVETVVTAGGALGVRAAIGSAERAAMDAAEASVTAAAKLTAKAATKALVKDVLIEQAQGIGQGLSEGQILNLVAMASGDKFDFTTLDPTGIAALVAAFNKPICNVLPSANIPVIANPRLAGQVFKGEAGNEGIYLVGPSGMKHKIVDEARPVFDTVRICGMAGPGDKFPDGSYRIVKGNGGAGLQEATGAAGLPRGQNLNLNECGGMKQALTAMGKWKFNPTR